MVEVKEFDFNKDFPSDLLASFQNSFVPNDNRPIYDWAHEHVDLQSGYGIKGKFDCSLSPQFKPIFDAYQDPFIREVNILASPRSGKTMTAEICLLHTLANFNGDILWLQITDEMAGKISDLRMMPLLKGCRPVADLIDTTSQYALTEGRYKFLHSTVHVTAPKENALNAIGYKFIFIDEAWKLDKKGKAIIKEIKRRADEYLETYKCLCFSQAGIKNGAWYDQFYSGIIYEWGWHCPKCEKLQAYNWRKKREDGTRSGIVWSDKLKDEAGKWMIKECAEQAVLECHHCRYQVQDDPAGLNRKHLLNGGKYIDATERKDFNPKVKSFKTNNIFKKPFSVLVRDYFDALEPYEAFGDNDKLEEFLTRDICEWWDNFSKKSRVEIRLSEYDPTNPYGDQEAYRFLTIDCQDKEPFFWYVVRAWNKLGESRLISYGNANTWKELDSIRTRHKVDYRFVFVDTGNGTKTESIYAECIKHGRWAEMEGAGEMWSCYNSLKGSGAPGFKHKDNKWYRYNIPIEIPCSSNDPADHGKSLGHVTWSNYRIKQILETLRDGLGRRWEAVDVTEEYTVHLNAEIQQRKIKGNKADFEYAQKPNTQNHLWDCECMQVVAADIYGCLESREIVSEIVQSNPVSDN